MEKIEKEQYKQQEVYSYVQDEHIKGYYTDGIGTVKLSPFVKFLRVVMYIVVSIISLIGVITVFTGEKPVFTLVSFLILVSIILLFFGLLSPALVVYGQKRTRGRVLAVYGAAIVVFWWC